MQESLQSMIIRTSIKDMGGLNPKNRSAQFFIDDDWFRVETEPSGYINLLWETAEKIWNAGHTVKHKPSEKVKINYYLHAWQGPVLEPLQQRIEGTGLEEMVYLSRGNPDLVSLAEYMALSSEKERKEALASAGRSLSELHDIGIVHRNPKAESLSIHKGDQRVYMTFLDFSSHSYDRQAMARDFSQCFISLVKHSKMDPDHAAIPYCNGYFSTGKDKEDMVEPLGTILDYNVNRFMFDATIIGFPARLAYQYAVFGMNHYKSQRIQERLHMRLLLD